jgi:hypothetical protein
MPSAIPQTESLAEEMETDQADAPTDADDSEDTEDTSYDESGEEDSLLEVCDDTVFLRVCSDLSEAHTSEAGDAAEAVPERRRVCDVMLMGVGVYVLCWVNFVCTAVSQQYSQLSALRVCLFTH